MKIRVKKRKGNLDNEHNKPPPPPPTSPPKKKKLGNQVTCEKQEWEGIEKYSIIKMFRENVYGRINQFPNTSF